MPRVSQYTADQRAAAAARVIDGGETVAAVAENVGAPHGTVSSWVRAERKTRAGADPAAAEAAPDELDAAQRREQDGTARKYLDYIAAPKPPRSVDKVRAALAEVTAKLEAVGGEVNTLTRLRLITQRIELEKEAAAVMAVCLSDEDADKLEAAFVAVGAAWARRHGFPADALREIGVPRKVLKVAGIT